MTAAIGPSTPSRTRRPRAPVSPTPFLTRDFRRPRRDARRRPPRTEAAPVPRAPARGDPPAAAGQTDRSREPRCAPGGRPSTSRVRTLRSTPSLRPTPPRARNVPRSSSATIRERSSCASNTLSYSGRNRIGTVMSSEGRRASGRSKSSTPRSSLRTWSRAREASITSPSRVSPDHDWTSFADAGPNAARYRITRSVTDADFATGRPSHRSTVVERAAPPSPQMPRGGTCTSGNKYRTAYASASGSRSGHWSPNNVASSAVVRGSSSTSLRPAATTASTSTPSRRRPNGLPTQNARSSTGCVTDRNQTQSSAVTRCKVPRMSAMRTAARCSMSSASASGRNASTRVHMPT